MEGTSFTFLIPYFLCPRLSRPAVHNSFILIRTLRFTPSSRFPSLSSVPHPPTPLPPLPDSTPIHSSTPHHSPLPFPSIHFSADFTSHSTPSLPPLLSVPCPRIPPSLTPIHDSPAILPFGRLELFFFFFFFFFFCPFFSFFFFFFFSFFSFFFPLFLFPFLFFLIFLFVEVGIGRVAPFLSL